MDVNQKVVPGVDIASSARFISTWSTIAMNTRSIFMLALLGFSGVVLAQNSAVVWSGGVGVDERENAPVEGTKLVFFVRGGDFLSGVTVVIKDASGREVVNAVSNGPWMVLNLPDGVYSVRASLGDKNAQGGRIEIKGKNQEFGYMFITQ